MGAMPLDMELEPDLLPLRDSAGRPCGLFSDHGSWLAACWGDGPEVFTLWDTTRCPAEEVFLLGVQQPVVRRVVWPDRLDIELADGSLLQLGYVERDLLFLTCPDDLPVRVERAGDGPDHRRVPGGWLIGRNPGLAAPVAPFVANRERWSGWRQRVLATLPEDATEQERRLALRAALTLEWNRRGPLGAMAGEGVIPTPFGYPGYWAAESWRVAHALAPTEPRLALALLHAQFARQAPDGMVPDTVRADPDDENWSNTKPPRAAWALEAIAARTGPDAIDALLPRCAAQLDWWHAQRRQADDRCYRPGGRDAETASWDAGWDRSHRFDGVKLSRRPPWRLLDLWPVDLNALLLVEWRAIARLAADRDAALAETAEQRARALESALGEAWDADLGLYVDRAPDAPPEWRALRTAASLYPLWAGLGGDDERAAMCAQILDPARFATPMPFPSVAADEPCFDPRGFANGSVFLEPAALALRLLGSDGAALRARLLDALAAWPSLYECYDPTEAAPVRMPQTAYPQASGTAAAVLELLRGGPSPAV